MAAGFDRIEAMPVFGCVAGVDVTCTGLNTNSGWLGTTVAAGVGVCALGRFESRSASLIIGAVPDTYYFLTNKMTARAAPMSTIGLLKNSVTPACAACGVTVV